MAARSIFPSDRSKGYAASVNGTMIKFGYPATEVVSHPHWTVLMRPAQATLGALVLAANAEATTFGALPPAAFAGLSTVISHIERALTAFRPYDRINYLMLMMVDPHVHFHVLPRYSAPQAYGGHIFPDPGWPGPPDLKSAPVLGETLARSLQADLKTAFNQTA
jgi:diadenosine tetraphosphate (Ap4A) HIT family hydrolase